MPAGLITDMNAVLEQYADTVLRAAYSMTKNRQDAEDISQEVFISLIRANPVFESDEHIKAWLLHATANRCKSFFRSAWQQKTTAIAEDYPEKAFTENENIVMDAVRALPEKYRNAVHLFYIEGYASKEIAAILHLPQNTVLSHLSRARKQLREILKGDFDFE